MNGDAYWTVDILLPYYTGGQRWRIVHGGGSEQLARRTLEAERRNGNRARLRCWTAGVVDGDELCPVDSDCRRPANDLVDDLPF